MKKNSGARILSKDDKKKIREDVRQQKAINSFRYFARYAWPTIEPGTTLRWNWHLEALSDDIEEFVNQMLFEPDKIPEVRTLVVVVPPRSLKSYLIGVVLQAWMWIHSPGSTVMNVANDDTLAGRDSMRLIELITSTWYREVIMRKHVADGGSWADPLPWGLSKRQATKINFENTQKGRRFALGIGSKVTGKGANLQIVDDPSDAKDALFGSAQQIEKRMAEVWGKYNEVLETRLNDPMRSLRLVVMQRLHRDDLAGKLIRKSLVDSSIKVIVIPLEFDPDMPEEL